MLMVVDNPLYAFKTPLVCNMATGFPLTLITAFDGVTLRAAQLATLELVTETEFQISALVDETNPQFVPVALTVTTAPVEVFTVLVMMPAPATNWATMFE